MDKVKCECGHVNPHGAILCEACGRPLEDEGNDNSLLNMRYEGSARRSQTYNTTIIDKIWNFFSSVKVGVWLIIITLVASSLGTIFPQEMYIPPNVSAAEYYEEQYGVIGKLYYELGFHNLYATWWYMMMVASIAISLVICSLDRVIPLYKALKKQRVTRHPSFLRRQRLFGITKAELTEDAEKQLIENLKAKRYTVRAENGNILAEKGRFSRWGPYVNHVGLIIFLIGCMLRFFPGMYLDEAIWIREGETRVIPGTNNELYLKSEGFIMEIYDEEEMPENLSAMEIVKNYQTNAILYERVGEHIPGAEPELREVKSQAIQVNKPLKYNNYALYQVDYKLNELYKMSFKLLNKETEATHGEITIDLTNPEERYDLGNGYAVELVSYFPDFYFNENDEPDTRTRIPNNPVFVFRMITPDTPQGEISFVGIQTNLEPLGENTHRMAFSGVEMRNVSGLTVRRDFTLPIIALGGIIFMIGLIQGSYWNHRRLWIQRQGQEIWVAAHTNKNWFGLKKEISQVFANTPIGEPIDQLEQEQDSKVS